MQSHHYASIAVMPPAERLREMAQLVRVARRLSLLGQRLRHPELSGAAWGRHIARLWLDQNFVPGTEETMWIQDSLGLAQQLHPLLEAAGVAYFITGGVASSAWGEPRTTRDLDLVIQVRDEDRGRLGAVLEAAGYTVAGLDSGTIQITHQVEITTADLIVSGSSPWDLAKFERRVRVGELWICSPEDLVLSKLRWGRGKSEKQTRDIVGILRASELDEDYLRDWAGQLGLTELLEAVLREAR